MRGKFNVGLSKKNSDIEYKRRKDFMFGFGIYYMLRQLFLNSKIIPDIEQI